MSFAVFLPASWFHARISQGSVLHFIEGGNWQKEIKVRMSGFSQFLVLILCPGPDPFKCTLHYWTLRWKLPFENSPLLLLAFHILQGWVKISFKMMGVLVAFHSGWKWEQWCAPLFNSNWNMGSYFWDHFECQAQTGKFWSACGCMFKSKQGKRQLKREVLLVWAWEENCLEFFVQNISGGAKGTSDWLLPWLEKQCFICVMQINGQRQKTADPT